jgi:topoisomerase-4 subunit B
LYLVKKGKDQTYAWNDEQRDAAIKQLKGGGKEDSVHVQRYKGLGEMNAEQLWETTLNPDTRRLLPVQLGTLDFAQTESLITQLMGKGEAAARRELMELHGDDIEVDI